WVRIHLQASENQLTFDIKNSKATDIKKEVQAGGIGLENVKRRLNLLYPQQHELTIENKENEYHVQLKINKL
ncbi:MAG: sensor histidine kinase, partial [Bacteroidia bacterium]|nr:sensor histidine kinase [Bacteroidia bacterium]